MLDLLFQTIDEYKKFNRIAQIKIRRELRIKKNESIHHNTLKYKKQYIKGYIKAFKDLNLITTYQFLELLDTVEKEFK